MRIFILEDDVSRIRAFKLALLKHDVTVAQWLEGNGGAYQKFEPPYDLLLLDHDLGGLQMIDSEGEDETGYHFVQWLTEAHYVEGEPKPSVAVHSYNYDGATNMLRHLHDNNYQEAVRLPFGPGLIDFLENLK